MITLSKNQMKTTGSKVEDVSKEWILEPEHEYRFEVDFSTIVKLKLISGTAEIYGTEIGIGPEYEFSGRKIALFTWHGTCSVEYVANETPMTSYLNMHLALEQFREETKVRDEVGPKVLIVGPEDVGKTSLSKILLSYALRQGRQPIFVDLDVNEGSVTMPGTLTATPINQIIDVEEGFGSSTTTLPFLGSSMIPITYYYGYSDPGENVKLYKMLTAKLANTVKLRIANDKDAKTSGIVIDTSGLIDNIGYEIIQHCVDCFEERPGINVLKLAKSGGVVDRDKTFRRQTQMRKIREYFYGLPKFELSPCSTLISLNEVFIYRVGVALPIGIDRKVSETQLVKVEPDDSIRHSILALTSANSPDEQNDHISTLSWSFTKAIFDNGFI
ncbi:2336_t:CDS:10 [Diversispora eburnea]|uniref:Polynucleotide 5'-hydroxyl-kinase GRC3 n=1 Tax=Diversispora eburnea TaxID=1213867 RepID=A0A9N8YP03_9GLOM|nr:2336_t:CDS:10 [Diversispora eburnea]